MGTETVGKLCSLALPRGYSAKSSANGLLIPNKADVMVVWLHTRRKHRRSGFQLGGTCGFFWRPSCVLAWHTVSVAPKPPKILFYSRSCSFCWRPKSHRPAQRKDGSIRCWLCADAADLLGFVFCQMVDADFYPHPGSMDRGCDVVLLPARDQHRMNPQVLKSYGWPLTAM